MFRLVLVIFLAAVGLCIVAAFILMCLTEPDDPRLPAWIRNHLK